MGVLKYFNSLERPCRPCIWRWGVRDGAGRFQGGDRSVALAAQTTGWLIECHWERRMVRWLEGMSHDELKQFSFFQASQRFIWRTKYEQDKDTAATAPMCALGRLVLPKMSLPVQESQECDTQDWFADVKVACMFFFSNSCNSCWYPFF